MKEGDGCTYACICIGTRNQPLLHNDMMYKGVGEGGGAGGGGHVFPHFQKWGAQVGLCPPLLGRANVLISLFAHILSNKRNAPNRKLNH